MTIVQNQKDFFVVEIPDFIYNSPRKPEKLTRSRFTFKTHDGLSYNLVTRIIRYNQANDGKYQMIISHTDQLESQAQRHFKREFFEMQCNFASVKENPKPGKNESKYIVSETEYEGKLSNISAGGCCIQTTLPIKEKQLIGVILLDAGIDETIIGIIRRTRKLPTGILALHIQFLEISLEARNRIYTLVYKYEL